MEKQTLATKEHDGTWFGVLIGDESRLLASAFSMSKKTLEGHLRADAPRTPIHQLTNGSKIALNGIPMGRVTSYGLIAKRISSGPRAVGTAVARNPWPLFIPCHRVVPASLEIGNYSIGGALSDYGCEVKRDLLEREGVSIEGDKIASKALWVPTGA